MGDKPGAKCELPEEYDGTEEVDDEPGRSRSYQGSDQDDSVDLSEDDNTVDGRRDGETNTFDESADDSQTTNEENWTEGAAENLNGYEDEHIDEEDYVDDGSAAMSVEVTMSEENDVDSNLELGLKEDMNEEFDERMIEEVINERIAEDLRNAEVEEEYLEIDEDRVREFEYTCNLCEFSASPSTGRWYLKSRRQRNVYYPCDMCTFVCMSLDSMSTKDKTRVKRPAAMPNTPTFEITPTQAESAAGQLWKPSSNVVFVLRPYTETAAKSHGSAAVPPFSSIKHSVAGVHPCEECDFVGGNSHALKKHKELRHEDAAFPCPSCEYVAHDAADLRVHVQSKHEGERFPCHLCNFFATRKSTLKTHIESIHRGVKYPCQLCAYAATQKSALKRHIRTVHNPLNPKYGTRYLEPEIIIP